MKILIVEDQSQVAEVLSRAMLHEFPDALTKVTGKLSETMALMNTQEWDLVLLDLTLHDASREETAKRIPDMLAKCKSIVIATGSPEGIVRTLSGMPEGIPIVEKPIMFEKEGVLHRVLASLFPRPQHPIGAKAIDTAESLARMDRLMDQNE